MTIRYKLISQLHKTIGITLALGLLSTPSANEEPVTREYSESATREIYDQLLLEYGNNKALPAGFELQALMALSHYPELKDVRVSFIVANVGIPLASRPHWLSMLRSADNRHYQVIIDNELKGERKALLLKNQPFNAQIGIIGHELSHTVYYLERSFFEILADAVCQFSKCRIGFERATDSRLINYGLGWQRYDHALFVRSELTKNREAAADSEGGNGAYMSPNELLSIMAQNPIYQSLATQKD
jgi:hypothetical protein